jgi:hypothetical protein
MGLPQIALFKDNNTNKVYTLPYTLNVDTVDIFGDNSIRAMYKLDNNGTDETGSFNGTPSSDASFIAGLFQGGYALASGKIDLPFELIGTTGDYITTPWTFSAWIYYKDTDNKEPIIQFGGYYNGIGFGIMNGNPRIATVTGGGNRYYAQAYGITLEQNRWYHLVAVFDTENLEFRLYVNKRLVAKKYGPGGFVLGTREACIGGIYNGQTTFNYTLSNTPLESLIDQVRIYNRALTDEEIQQLDYYIDETSDWQYVNDVSSLTFEDFATKGLIFPVSITKNKLQELSDNISLLLYPSQIEQLQIKAVPKPQILVQKVPVDISDYDKINYIQVLTTNLACDYSPTRFVFSRDGQTWYTYDFTNNEFKEITNNGLDPNNPDDVNLVINNGVPHKNLGSISSDAWKQIYPDKMDYFYICIGFYEETLADVSSISSSYINVTTPPPYNTYSVSVSTVENNTYMTFSTTGKYIINYIV